MNLAALVLAVLPVQIAPAAPFPHILADAPTLSTVAPGIAYGEYDLVTDAGPIVVHVVSVAPHRPDISINTVLSHDTLTSPGERVSTMASSTGAVAGINGDYFDIGNTDQPTNVLVSGGVLERSPRKRAALVIERDGTPQITELTFTGQLTLANGNAVAIDGLNVIPPPGDGLSLLTPSFGPVPPRNNLTLVAIQPTSGTPPFATYRVTGILDNTIEQPPGYYVAIGLNAYDSTGVPNPGDALTARGDLAPIGLADIAAAVGGGPLILDSGTYVHDPDGPNGPGYDGRIPTSGAGITADGTLLLFEVDGRQPDYSVGVTRPELAALMSAFGAVRGMAFDGGGSSTLAVRALGSPEATLANVPSDGTERRVADGLFVYSEAPVGAASRIVAEPSAVRAFVGASVPLALSAIDAAEHVLTPASFAPRLRVEPASLGRIVDGAFVALAPGTGRILLRSGTLRGSIPVEVSDDPARLLILPATPNVAEHARLQLTARAYDAQGYALALPATLPWRAQHGTIASDGELDAGTHDMLVSLLLGDHLADVRVTVGSHDVALPFSAHPRFLTVPRGGDGLVTTIAGCDGCVALRYALGPTERAAYALAEVPLPLGTVAIAFDLQDDSSGAHVKIALRNAQNQALYLPAVTLDRPGWRHVIVRLPSAFVQPARLTAIYAIGPPDDASGTIAIRNVRAIVAGSP